MKKIFLTLIAGCCIGIGAMAQTAYDMNVQLKDGTIITYAADDVEEVTFAEQEEEEFNILTPQCIPDAAFLSFVKSTVAKGADVYTNLQAKNHRGYMNVVNGEIADFTGIEYFVNLDSLRIQQNKLYTSLDLSTLKNLVYLNIYFAQSLTEIKLGDIDKMVYLNLMATNLCNLTRGVDGRATLTTAEGTFDIANCKSLRYLDLGDVDNLTSINVTGCENLFYLNTYNTKISELDLTGCNKLAQLYAQNNHNLTEINISHLKETLTNLNLRDTRITTLDVVGFSKLIQLTLQAVPTLTSLDVTGCTALQRVRTDDSNVSSLDLRHCSSLTEVHCYNNQNLKTLLIGDATKLTTLTAYNTGIETVEIGNTPMMRIFYASYCPSLIKIDISKINHNSSIYLNNNPKLTEIKVWSDFDMNNPPANVVKDTAATFVYEFTE